MKRLHSMKEMLVSCIEGQMTHLDSVDTKELGEAIDMVKDLAEAIYYCTITESMQSQGYTKERNWESENSSRHKMYYGTMEREYPYDFDDYREGKSFKTRKMYMEAKETHQEKSVQMRELEKYVHELSDDIIEMLSGTTSEEKQFLSKKISALATKVAQMND